jgi:DNA topoisomerase-1
LGFDDIINTDFTRKMEEELDEIAQGKKKENEVLNKWYAPFADLLNKAYENIKSLKPPPQSTDKVCELCGAPMVIREGRYGKFLACSNFPKCRNTKPLKKEETDEICEKCGKPMVVKHNKYGVRFLACSGYPKCKNTKPYSIGIKCPRCEKGELTEKGSKNGKFYRCSRYPECKFIVRGEIVKQKCPQCKNEFLVKEKKWLKCPKCGWKKEAEDEV